MKNNNKIDKNGITSSFLFLMNLFQAKCRLNIRIWIICGFLFRSLFCEAFEITKFSLWPWLLTKDYFEFYHSYRLYCFVHSCWHLYRSKNSIFLEKKNNCFFFHDFKFKNIDFDAEYIFWLVYLMMVGFSMRECAWKVRALLWPQGQDQKKKNRNFFHTAKRNVKHRNNKSSPFCCDCRVFQYKRFSLEFFLFFILLLFRSSSGFFFRPMVWRECIYFSWF